MAAIRSYRAMLNYGRLRRGCLIEFLDPTGRMLDVRVQVPRFHGDGRADWDVMVTIVYRDWAAMEEHSDKEIIERLFPDQARYKRG